MDYGKKLKELRKKNELTLEELAIRCELTKGFLSQVERNLTSPSIQTLDDILEALGTNLSEFFSEDTDNRVVFTPKDHYVSEQDGINIRFIVPNAQKNKMEPIIVTLQKDSRTEKIAPYDGEEAGYVLKGEITLVNGDERFRVKSGESFYLKGTHEHYLENTKNKEARVLWVITPPNF